MNTDEWDATYFKIGRPTRLKSLLPMSITYKTGNKSVSHIKPDPSNMHFRNLLKTTLYK